MSTRQQRSRQDLSARWHRLRAALKAVGAATAAALVAVACGGGGDGGIDGTGVVDNGMSYGTVTGFGSVWVNGLRFDTSNATFRLDDSTVTQGDLRLGMVVRVDGSIDDRRARTVTVDEALKGRVEQVIDASRFIVLGQTVLVDNNTGFDNGTRPAAGDYVEVHGLVTGDGTVSAGFVQIKTTFATPPFVVKGLVKNHDAAAATFQVGTLTVRYAGAVTSDMPGGSWNGLAIDAKGAACAGDPVCGTLTASKVEPGGPRAPDIAKAEIEGFVTSVGGNGFVVAGQSVAVNAATNYAGGVASEVVAGVRLEVEGPIAGGVLTATKVVFKDSLRFEADVATVNVGAGTLTLAGLPGITVQVSALTQMKNVTDLAGLAGGNHLRIKARPGPGNSALAVELERRSVSSDPRVVLQGPVSATASTTTLTVLGVVVDTTTVANSEFRNLTDAAIGRAAFFAALADASSTLVKARGVRSAGGAVTWDQMELED